MRGLSRAIAAEAAKVLSTRLWWVLGLILFGYVGIAAVALPLALSVTPEEGAPPLGDIAPLVYSLATSAGFVVPVVFGSLSITSELRHRTVTAVFLATPHRASVLVAKAILAAIVGVVYALVGLAVSVGPGAGMLALTGQATLLDDPDTWAMLARAVLAMAIWGVLGVGLGVLIPSQIGSIVAILVFTQFVEPIARSVGAFVDWFGSVARFLPGAAGDALVGASFYSAFGGGTEPLAWWAGGLVLVGYALVFGTIGALTTWRRDVT